MMGRNNSFVVVYMDLECLFSLLNTGYGSSMNYNSGYGSGMYGSQGMYGSSYGGLGGSYGGGLYGNSMQRGGYGGGLYGGSGMYGGGMYNSGLGSAMGGYGMGTGMGMGMGMGMGPYGEQDPNNPYGGPPSPPGFWISFLRVVRKHLSSFILSLNISANLMYK